MKKRLYILILIIPLFISCDLEDDISGSENEILSMQEYLDVLSAGEVIPGHYIVGFSETFKDEIRSVEDRDKRLALVQKMTTDVLQSSGRAVSSAANYYYFNSFIGFAGKLTERTLNRLSEDKRIGSIEEDIVYALSPTIEASGRVFRGERKSYGVKRVNGGIQYQGDKKVFIVDSGVDDNHEDLNVDIEHSHSVFSWGFDSRIEDRTGHGSHVAGIIGAIDNQEGIVGVAAGMPITAIKVLNWRGSGSTSGVLAGFDYIMEIGKEGDVVNMSFGGRQSDALDEGVEEVADKGLLIALSAGNEESDVRNFSPSGVDHDNILTVSAMDDRDRWADYSNYGKSVDYCAPGDEILSCYKGGDYAVLSGTSMAAPHVAGLLILGEIRTNGKVRRDPDRWDDPIAVHQAWFFTFKEY